VFLRNYFSQTAAVNLLCPLLCVVVSVTRCSAQHTSQDSIRLYLDTVEISRKQEPLAPAAAMYTHDAIAVAPGTLGDPARVLISSGETITNSDIQAIPLIDGDAADEFLTLLDGYPISFPFRLLGVYSLFNTLTTKNIELSTKGYPVVYGGRAPTALQITSLQEYSSHPSLEADVSLPISSACIRIPVSDTLKCSATAAVRISHADLIAQLLPEQDRKRMESFIPDLKDAQFFLTEMPSLNMLSTQEILMSDEHGSLNSQDRAFDYSWKKYFAGASLWTSTAIHSEHHISYSFDHVLLSTAMPIEGYGSGGYENGMFQLDGDFSTVRWQSQFHNSISPTVAMTTGFELSYEPSDTRFTTLSGWLNSKSPVQSSSTDAAVFTEATWHLTETTSSTFGFRSTYFGFINLVGFEPRWNFHSVIDRHIQMDISAGEYLQAPSDFQILYGFLNFLAMPDQSPRMMLMSEQRSNLNPERHLLASTQLRTKIIDEPNFYFGFDINGYVKRTLDFILPARYPSIFTPLDTLSFEPLQCFRAEKSGAGISFLMVLPQHHLSLTTSLFSHRSRIVDTRTEHEYRDEGDIPRLVKMLLQYSTGEWNVSVLYQYSSGMPTTDQYYLKSFSDDLYLHLWKEINTSRVSDYRRLDFTVTRTWHIHAWNLICSAGIINVLGARNVSSYLYELSPQLPDDVEKVPVMNTLPFLPVLDVKAEYSW